MTSFTLSLTSSHQIQNMSFKETVNFVETCIYIPIITVGLTLNILIMKTALQQCRKRSSEGDKVNNYFLFNLAIADLGTLCLVIPLQIVELNVFVWPFGEFFCRFLYSVTNSISYVSVLSITALSLNRNWLLLRPSWLSCLSPTNVKCIVVLMWWFSYTVIGLPLTFVMKVDRQADNSSACDPIWPSNESQALHIAYLTSFMVIPLLATSSWYYRIKRVFRKFVTSGTGAVYVTPSYGNSFLVKLRKFTRLLNVIVCGFWICYTPYLIMALVIAYSSETPRFNEFWYKMTSAARVMLYTNPVVNPLVLIIFSKPYRKEIICFRRLCRQIKEKRTVISFEVRSKIRAHEERYVTE